MSDTMSNLRLRQQNLLLAINRIENGAQEYRIGSRTVRRADLATLYEEYHRLDEQILHQTRPPMTRAVLPRRR